MKNQECRRSFPLVRNAGILLATNANRHDPIVEETVGEVGRFVGSGSR